MKNNLSQTPVKTGQSHNGFIRYGGRRQGVLAMGEVQERLAEMKAGELQAAERELCSLLNAHAAVLLRAAAGGLAPPMAASSIVRLADLCTVMLPVGS